MNVYPFIEAKKARQGNVKRACELVKVSRSAYDQHRTVAPPAGRHRTGRANHRGVRRLRRHPRLPTGTR